MNNQSTHQLSQHPSIIKGCQQDVKSTNATQPKVPVFQQLGRSGFGMIEIGKISKRTIDFSKSHFDMQTTPPPYPPTMFSNRLTDLKI